MSLTTTGRPLARSGLDDLRGNNASEPTLLTQGAMFVLRTEYKATTTRMLRVAVNGFMESVGVVLGVMEELDVDVLGSD